jgi:phosphoserine phosphatase
LLIAGALCNDAVLQRDEGEAGGYRAIGDPTEGALVVAAACAGILQHDLQRAFPRIAELPFDSVRKRMTTVHRVPRAPAEVPPGLARVWARRPPGSEPPPYLAVTKGSIDGMLAIASAGWVEGRSEPLDDALRARIQGAHEELARDGLRVLCIGLRRLQDPPGPGDLDSIERELILVGLVGMMDPPRPEVRDAVRVCRTAGIRPVMITGDHPLTARHVARSLGIVEDEAFVTGAELDGRSDTELRRLAGEVSVFARVSPAHKIRLVQAYQAEGNVVAMTGDGVNDAPALKKADIGLAMGVTGTDVAKEAAQLVLLDDNFATIVAAVQEGRVVYDNVRRFIKYLLASNASEVAVMLLGPLLGMPLPLLPLQILWMNLVTDGLPALALGVDPAEDDVMRRPPQAATASIFGRGMVAFVVVMGLVASMICLAVGVLALQAGDVHWQTLVFDGWRGSCFLPIGMDTRRLTVVAATVLVAASAGAAGDGLPVVLPAGDFEAREVDYRVKLPPSAAAELRQEALAHARLFTKPETPIEKASFAHNPPAPFLAPRRDEAVCKFIPRKVGGTTPKFFCVFEGGRVLKVKYGRDAEIHAEVAASRLLHALGAGANHMYYLKTLRCFGCPREPERLLRCLSSESADVRRDCERVYGDVTAAGELELKIDYGKYVDFTKVSVEDWAEGKTIETPGAEGWGWDELERAQAAGEGASRAERDALRLLAVFLDDWDNSADNQRLICLPGGQRADGRCTRPFAYMDDVGATFGRAGRMATQSESKLDVEGWKRVPIWKDREKCVVAIHSPMLHHATFDDAVVTEAGRKMVADRLGRLRPRQIRGLFEGSGFVEFEGATNASLDVDHWVEAFQEKVKEIVERGPCPAS